MPSAGDDPIGRSLPDMSDASEQRAPKPSASHRRKGKRDRVEVESEKSKEPPPDGPDKESRTNEEDKEAAQEEEWMRIMALCHFRPFLGVACYDEMQNSIFVDNVHFSLDDCEEIIAHLKLAMNPTLFLLHPGLIDNESVLDVISRGLDGTPNEYEFKVLKSSAWSEKQCTNTIYSHLKISALRTNFFQALAAYTDVDCPPVLPALGALVSYLQETAFQLDGGAVQVAALAQVPNDSYLRIDGDSFAALQIFAEEVHPSWLKGKGRSKEGFSLFSFMDRTHSLPGRQKLRDWMARPLSDMAAIAQRQQGVAFVVSRSNHDLMRTITTKLKHIHNMPRALLRIKKVQSNFMDWCKLHTSLVAAADALMAIHEFIRRPTNAVTEDVEFLQTLVEDSDMRGLYELASKLDEWIDFASSAREKEIVIKEGRDSILDEKRELYRDLEGYLVQAAHKILECTPAIQSLSVEYVPQVGYLAAIEEQSMALLSKEHLIHSGSSSSGAPQADSDSCSSTIVSDEDKFAFVFSQGKKHFFKHRVVQELDQRLGDLQSDIQDRQRIILVQLEELILEMELSILKTASTMATIDAFSSLGAIAVENGLVRPEIVEDAVVVIKNGRHLLQELMVESFVPNDTLITPEKNVAIITGPNNSGKSIYLKQVGLIVYLAHIGSWVPCDHAIIGLTDRILTRISSVESVVTPQSSFTMDLTQMAKMLNTRTERSLCLVDEFGKGTNPVDGMALLSAIIESFADTKSKSVFVLHFTEILFENAINKTCMKSVHCFHMETILQPNKGAVASDFDDDNDNQNENRGSERMLEDPYEPSIPLYKLKFGIVESSKGIECAQRMGVSREVVDRALYAKSCIQANKPIEPRPVQDIWLCPAHKDLLRAALETDWLVADDAVLDKIRGAI